MAPARSRAEKQSNQGERKRQTSGEHYRDKVSEQDRGNQRVLMLERKQVQRGRFPLIGLTPKTLW